MTATVRRQYVASVSYCSLLLTYESDTFPFADTRGRRRPATWALVEPGAVGIDEASQLPEANVDGDSPTSTFSVK